VDGKTSKRQGQSKLAARFSAAPAGILVSQIISPDFPGSKLEIKS